MTSITVRVMPEERKGIVDLLVPTIPLYRIRMAVTLTVNTNLKDYKNNFRKTHEGCETNEEKHRYVYSVIKRYLTHQKFNKEVDFKLFIFPEIGKHHFYHVHGLFLLEPKIEDPDYCYEFIDQFTSYFKRRLGRTEVEQMRGDWITYITKEVGTHRFEPYYFSNSATAMGFVGSELGPKPEASGLRENQIPQHPPTQTMYDPFSDNDDYIVVEKMPM